MRLTAEEAQALRQVIFSFLSPGQTAQLLLFGSRARDDLRGGDIDLAFVVDEPAECQRLQLIDFKILAALQSHPAIGPQKIDLKILTPAQAREPFFAQALAGAKVIE